MKTDIKQKNKDFSGFLSEGTSFKGILSFSGTFRIDCKFEGEIISNDTLIIGENATISADITIGSIFVSGKVIGNIIASDRIEICTNGEVYGNIDTPVLKISEGVIFEGNCKMKKNTLKENKLTIVS